MVWEVSQIVTAPLSDGIGRKPLITPSMMVPAVGLGLTMTTQTYAWWLASSVIVGSRTAMMYPALIAMPPN